MKKAEEKLCPRKKWEAVALFRVHSVDDG